ncbi:MAG: YfhO family protein [Candidatus Kapaibacteriales bacterium]
MAQSKKHKGRIISIKPPKDIPIWIIFLLFFVTTFVFFADQILMNSFFWEDFVEYVYPVQTFSAKMFAKGEIPFWNPFTFAGMPFFADIQVGFFYVFNRILSLFTLSSGNLPVLALELIIIFHFFISQISMYFFARYLNISSYGGLISAVSYSFSMLMVAHVIHPMIIYHLSWLPLILLLYLKSIEKSSFYYSILAGLVLGMVMLSGHPQTTLYIFVFLAIAGVFQIAYTSKAKITLGKILSNVFIFILPFLIGFGIFAVQFLPSKELAKYSKRNETSLRTANEGSLQFQQIYTAIVPKLFGWVEGSDLAKSNFYLKFDGELQRHFFWETVFYFGITAAILGLFAVLVGYKEKFVLLMIIFVVFGFMYAIGSGSPIFDILYHLPYFGIFRNPSRMLFFVVFGMSVLGGFGFDYLWQNALQKKTFIKFFVPVLLAFIIVILSISGVFARMFDAPFFVNQTIEDSANLALILLSITVILSTLLNRGVLPPAVVGGLFFILTFLDLYIVGSNFNRNPNNPEKIYELKPELRAMLIPKPPTEIFRVNMRVYEPIRFMAMQRNQGLIDNIMLVEGYNPLILERVLPPVNDSKVVMDLYNVRYEVKVDLEKGTWAFAERNNYFPRVWLVDKVHISDSINVVNFMKESPINYYRSVVLEGKINFPNDTTDSLSYNVKCEYYSNNYLKYKVVTNKTAIAVFSEIWYPDWVAFIDGKQTQILRANYCFRAVEIPPGEHTIEMNYDSVSFRKGSIISLVTFFIGLVGLIIFYRIEIAKHLEFQFFHKQNK